MKTKILLLVLATALFAACGSDDNDEPVKNDDGAGKYLVTMEVSGKDYTAHCYVQSSDNVRLYDEIEKKDTQQSMMSRYFTGKVSYSTLEPVKNFAVQGILLADSTSTLKMVVYKDGKNVYEKSLTVDKKAEINNLVFTVINGAF